MPGTTTQGRNLRNWQNFAKLTLRRPHSSRGQHPFHPSHDLFATGIARYFSLLIRPPGPILPNISPSFAEMVKTCFRGRKFAFQEAQAQARTI